MFERASILFHSNVERYEVASYNNTICGFNIV